MKRSLMLKLWEEENGSPEKYAVKLSEEVNGSPEKLMQLSLIIKERGNIIHIEGGINPSQTILLQIYGHFNFTGSDVPTLWRIRRKEEETELRNHLEWARVLVKGGESRIPKEVKIECEGVGYVIQIWDETLTRFHAREDKVEVATGECVYAPNNREEREEEWWELAAVRCLFNGPWVVTGDFNVEHRSLLDGESYLRSVLAVEFEEIAKSEEVVEAKYLDDTLVFCGADEDQLKYLRIIFIRFEAISGLHINWGKRFFSPKPMFEYILSGEFYRCILTLPPNAAFQTVVGPEGRSTQLSRQLVCLDACKKLHQLGALNDHLLPFNEKPSQSDSVVQDKKSGAALIDNVLDATRTYMMFLFPIPKSVIEGLDVLRRNFLWQGNSDREFREVIIVPEIAINAGWSDIALKIDNFINNSMQQRFKQPPKQTIPYAKVVERSKWQQQHPKVSQLDGKGLLGRRSIIGFFERSETPTPADVKRWATLTWKKAFGVNVYEMTGHLFLFEFPNRHIAEQYCKENGFRETIRPN
ncbi:hypothetical protein FXO38_12893 [Capsicum annuum]|uniref:Dicer dsRNA-binding fold domain-containing protein n=1 Tax=Capsicum annuum TaxID=4072 RepID=A0A2G2YX78_CAPAN|nr:hypothetical protein FXO38_12893 [Capsicum annuum]PHT74362.1 hypothetical protein T459_21639 [Capsicum annuum]